MRNAIPFKNKLSNHKIINSSVILLLCLLIYLTFNSAINNEFLYWDDQFYITANPHILQPTVASLKAQLFAITSLNYHPITMISLWVNALISGTESASPFIITNVLLHLINSILVYVFIYSLKNRDVTYGLCVASLFAVHPLHVESVVWVSERKDVLFSAFFLLALISYLRYLEKKNKGALIFSFVLFVLSCLSKAMAVTYPLCLFLLDLYKKRNYRKAGVYLEKVPFLLTSLLFGMLAIHIQSGGNLFGILEALESKNAISKDLGIFQKVENAFYANTFYLKNFIYPSNHSVFHPYLAVKSIPFEISSIITLAFIASLYYSYKKKWKNIVFGLLFYLINIVLVLQLIPVGSAIVAERYTYLPYLGLSLIAANLIKCLFTHISWPIITTAFVTIIGCLSICSKQQVKIWKNHICLFSQAVQQYEEDPNSRKSLASGFWKIGELDSAIYHIKYAINELGLTTSPAFELLATCHADKGNIEKAIAFYNEAIRLDQENIIAYYHRGLLLIQEDPWRALEDFNMCERSNNKYVQSLIYAPRGRTYGVLGQYDKAIADLNTALQFDPSDEFSYQDRAVTYEKLKYYELAKEDYAKVLELNPKNIKAKERLKYLNHQNS